MRPALSYSTRVPPREQISEFILYALGRDGAEIPQIYRNAGKPIPDDLGEHLHGHLPVWHRRTEILEYVGREMRLDNSMWGDKRISSDFYNAVDQELAKLCKKGIVAKWNESGNRGLFRIMPGHKISAKPSVTMAGKIPGRIENPEPDDMKDAFLSIITQGRKDNTYKFALGRAILEHCRSCDSNTEASRTITYSYLARKFLEYYWHQECKFRIKQDFKTQSDPKVITAIREIFGDKTPGDFALVDEDEKKRAEKKILSTVFGHARLKTSLVVPKFQKIMVGRYAEERPIFYDYDDEKKVILLRPEAFDFFKRNHGVLFKALLAEWAKFLERINGSLPRLVAKIEQDEFERGSLAPFRKAYSKYADHCFYCSGRLERRFTHVDHFIPWSYIFEDKAWNLVLACQNATVKSSAHSRRRNSSEC